MYYFTVCIIFAQLSKGKSVGYLSDLYNDLCTLDIVNNTLSLLCTFKFQFATPCQIDGRPKLQGKTL